MSNKVVSNKELDKLTSDLKAEVVALDGRCVDLEEKYAAVNAKLMVLEEALVASKSSKVATSKQGKGEKRKTTTISTGILCIGFPPPR